VRVELGSCSGSGSSLRGSVKPLYLHLFILWDLLSLYHSYLHGYTYFECESCLIKVIFTFVCGFIERLACYSLSIRLSSRASCKHGAYTMLYLWVHHVLWLCGSSGWWQSHLSFVVYSELNGFLNCRTVVTSVELSIVGALPSKRRLKVHKSRVSLNYSWVHTYFDLVIRIS
jgi:hypothetical protein